MICTSIQDRSLEEIWDILDSGKVEMAEIRLDRCPLSQDEIEQLFAGSDVPLVATCRVAELMEGGLSESKASQSAEAKLISAITSGAAYVDVEMEAPAMMAKRIRREARECGTTLIRSYHDFKGTDSENALVAIVEKCHHLGGEIVKIVTTATSKEDAQRVLSLYSRFPSESLIAFCMGDEGRDSRIGCLTCGAPFSYAAISEAEAAAPGQWPVEKMAQKVYAGRNLTGQECGSLTMPSSKSFAQRAIIFASLAQGTSHLSGYTPCGDNDSAIAVAKALGAKVVEDGDTLHITGTGCSAFRKGELHTGESGFLTRLMIPLLGVLAPSPVKVTGEKTLLSRPLKGARELMDAFGVTLESEGEEAMVPLTVKGALTPAKTTISGKGGSQIVSGLLSALPLLGQDSEVYLTEPKSIPYIFITLEVLKKFGIGISADMEGGEQFAESQDWAYCDAITFRIPGGQTYKAASFKIESDWSSAANFLVAGAIFGQADIEGLDTSSLQADLSIMDILTEAGASLSQDEESGVLHVQRAPLRAFDVDENNCPDLFPITAVLASMCQGTSRIQGVKRLSSKESDRSGAIIDMLSKMGVKASVKGDTMMIEGHSLCQRLLAGKLLKGGSYTSNHDHRMVMALKVASLGADSPVTIDDEACVGKSFPSFNEVFEKYKR